MRKYLIAGVALVACCTIAAPAMAQSTPGAELNVSVSPKKAGTKTRPKNTTIDLVITNKDVSQTADRIKIWIPKTLRLSNKGFKRCNVDALGVEGPAACKSARVGGGTALARAGVDKNPLNPPQLEFKVDAYVTGARTLLFYIRSTAEGSDIVAPVRATLKKASGKYGQLLDVVIPFDPAQWNAATGYNGLESLDVEIGARRGNNFLIASTGCNRGKAPFKAEIGFAENPGPPKVETVSDTFNAKCSK